MSIPHSQSQSQYGRWNVPASPDAATTSRGLSNTADAGTGVTRFEDSPTVGRTVSSPGSSNQHSPAPYLSFSGPRPPRTAVPSPLSPNSRPHANSGPRIDTYTPTQRSMGPPDTQQTYTSQRDAVEQTTFYSDSSSPPSPEPPSPRDSSPTVPNETRSVSDPIAARSPPALRQVPKPATAGSTTMGRGEPPTEMPRNSSIDSAISAVSSKMAASGPTDTTPTSASDIPALIKKAGSPEAVIQYLLKEKQSQAQQNNQLWRLVDKQRAMILGLNKDLERALKEKEKYRMKLRDVMSDPAVSRAAGVEEKSHDTRKDARPSLPSVDVSQSSARAAGTPDSPILDSDSQKHSPIDVAMAPYPITPPADQTVPASSGVSELLDPVHTMPKSQEHAMGRYDHDAEERAEELARSSKKDEEMKGLPYNANLPPSRSIPSEPPRVPPPKPPSASPPTLSVLEASPRPDDGLGGFPAPPRKAPPAPLQLKQDSRAPVPDEDESDSDYEEILNNVDGALNEKRGRRRTRAEDDRIREIMAFRDAEAKSMSNTGGGDQADAVINGINEAPQNLRNSPGAVQSEVGAASLDAVLQGDRRRDLAPALMSPGLPSSPRPPGMGGPVQSPPLSPRSMGAFPPAPLSPRPPRQAIPLPPNTPMATPGGDNLSSIPPSVAKRIEDPSQPPSPSSKSRDSPVERTRVYKGLVTDEYPDLLLPPNALPSIIVQVASSRMKPSRASLISLTQLEEDPVFTLAVISRSEGGELWRVEKDSASLSKLDQRLKQCPSFTAKTPDKSLFIGHAPAKLDARRQALDHYMDELVNTPLDINTALELCRYLSTNVLPPNADETGSASGSAAEGSGHMIGPDGRPVRSGYLTKRGKNFGGWKARYFLLDGPLLKYYETPGGAHLGTIKLQNAQIGKQHQNADSSAAAQGASGEETEYRHAFLVLEPKKKDSSSHVKHVLCAESDRERDLWVDALLQWIDYRDPNDEETSHSAPSAHERHAERHGKTKKSKQIKNQHQPPESEALVSVRYDSTQAGEAPHVAAQRSKGSGGADSPSSNPAEAEMRAQASKMISGPKDPQPISDSTAWGNKTGLPVPSYEEKKQRKRSFFGFGPKARSSADGTDALFDSGATPPQGTYSGPVKQVFGSPLAEAVKYNPPVDVRVPLPSVVYRCIQYLDAKDAILEEGIFRLSGSNVVIKQLRERFNTEGDVNLVTDDQFYDIHAVASLLKLYLRELPTTILTRDLHVEFMATTEMTDKKEKLAALNELAQRLPLSNETLLKYLISFLIKIINNADMNKMTVRNVGIVFSPTLNIPAPVFALFLQNYEAIFGINPEDYELPILRKEQGQQSRGYEPPLPRPSNSSGSASPHRQPRLDSMRDYQRSTPTPPLRFDVNAKAPPTPQHARTQGYEPPYSQGAVSNNGSGNGGRPAYDNLYGAQNTPDGYTGYPSSRANQHHGSQEDPNGGLAPYEQSYGSTSRSRRESAIFMGNVMGLQPQNSKSRLREEARY